MCKKGNFIILLILFCAGCATTNYNSSSGRNWNTKQEENNGGVSSEKKVWYNGRYYTYRIEARGDYIYEYWDGVVSKKSSIFEFVKKSKCDDFKVTDFVMGDSSMIWLGIDGNKNYGLIFQKGIVGEVENFYDTYILPVEELVRRGINVKVIYDKSNKEYIIKLEKGHAESTVSKYNEDGKTTYNNSKTIDELFPEE